MATATYLQNFDAAWPPHVGGTYFMAGPYVPAREGASQTLLGHLRPSFAGKGMYLPNQKQQPHVHAPSNTQIIFDWDDTLMCSSAITSGEVEPVMLRQFESLLETILEKAMKLGSTCIVTNAAESWVLKSARRFTPRVVPLLQKVLVVSARDRYGSAFPDDSYAWKRETFREIVGLQARAAAPNGLNLVVLGDSPAEMEAAWTSIRGLAPGCGAVAVKTVKFKDGPSLADLLEQLRIVARELGDVVTAERSGNRNLADRMWTTSLVPSVPLGSL